MSCNWGQIISFWGDIINLWGHIISFWGHIISFWGRYPYWGQGSIGGKIIILWGDFELGARLLTYGGILLTFGGVIINNMFFSRSFCKPKQHCSFLFFSLSRSPIFSHFLHRSPLPPILDTSIPQLKVPCPPHTIFIPMEFL